MDSLEEISRLVSIHDSKKALEEKIEEKAIEKSTGLFCDFEEKLSGGLITVYSFLSSANEHFEGRSCFGKYFEGFGISMNFYDESEKSFKKKGLLEIDTSPYELRCLGINLQMSPEYTRFVRKRTGAYNLSYISGWRGKTRKYTGDYKSEKNDLFSTIKEIKEIGELTYSFLMRHESPEYSQIFKKMITALKNLPNCLNAIYKEEERHKKDLLNGIKK